MASVRQMDNKKKIKRKKWWANEMKVAKSYVPPRKTIWTKAADKQKRTNNNINNNVGILLVNIVHVW